VATRRGFRMTSTDLVAHVSGIPDLADRNARQASTEAFAAEFTTLVETGKLGPVALPRRYSHG
jgi:hypothetical protein